MSSLKSMGFFFRYCVCVRNGPVGALIRKRKVETDVGTRGKAEESPKSIAFFPLGAWHDSHRAGH